MENLQTSLFRMKTAKIRRSQKFAWEWMKMYLVFNKNTICRLFFWCFIVLIIYFTKSLSFTWTNCQKKLIFVPEVFCILRWIYVQTSNFSFFFPEILRLQCKKKERKKKLSLVGFGRSFCRSCQETCGKSNKWLPGDDSTEQHFIWLTRSRSLHNSSRMFVCWGGCVTMLLKTCIITEWKKPNLRQEKS